MYLTNLALENFNLFEEIYFEMTSRNTFIMY